MRSVLSYFDEFVGFSVRILSIDLLAQGGRIWVWSFILSAHPILFQLPCYIQILNSIITGSSVLHCAVCPFVLSIVYACGLHVESKMTCFFPLTSNFQILMVIVECCLISIVKLEDSSNDKIISSLNGYIANYLPIWKLDTP